MAEFGEVQQKLRVHFTYHRWNLFSWLIRWALPRSRFALALVSHSMLVDGAYVIEATFQHGVRRVLASVALANAVIVETTDFTVPDAERGLAWARCQVGAPYDRDGALGLGLAVDRDWRAEGSWFCFELVAVAIERAGRPLFRSVGHVTGSALLMIKP